MSDFLGKAVHPDTGETREAWFFDDYFGPRKYGVQFVGEDTVWRIEDVKVPLRKDTP